MKAVQLILGLIIAIGGLFVLPDDTTAEGIIVAALVGVGIWIIGMLAAGDTYEGVYKPGSVFAPVLPIVAVLAAAAIALMFIFDPPLQ
jgi:hypothetical protein